MILIKKFQTTLLFTLFFLTIGLLTQHLFLNRITPPQIITKSPINKGPVYKVKRELNLGVVKVHNYQDMNFTQGFIKFSPDNKHLAVGTENGELLLLDNQGNIKWQKKIGLGQISSLAFSYDGGKVIVGENSIDGNIYSLDTVTGNENWRYSTSRELGSNLKKQIFPTIINITVDIHGFVYAVGQRTIKEADGRMEYLGRIYKFDGDGNLSAMFPSEYNLDACISWLSVDKQGNRLVFGTANWYLPDSATFSDTIYCLNTNMADVLWSKNISPISPYQNTTLRNNPNISSDGRYITAMSGDGRGFLFDATSGKELWQRTITQPQKINGVYINAVGMYAQINSKYTIFAAGNTYNRANWRQPTPIQDPNSNSLFLFDLDGKLINRCLAGNIGMLEQLAATDEYIALAVGRNIKIKDSSIHGVYVFSVPEASLVERLVTDGPCVGVSISPDGKQLAAIEAPLQLDNGDIIGSYKLIFFDKQR